MMLLLMMMSMRVITISVLMMLLMFMLIMTQDLPGMLVEFPRQLGTISYLEIWMYVVVMGEIGTLLEDV